MQGKVLELFITKEEAQKKSRVRMETIQVDEDGILNDKFYAKDSLRAILITSLESYTMANNANIILNSGSLGENILIDINPYGLKEGARLMIGNTILEITQNCTLCKGLSTIDSKLPKLLKNDRGIFAKYIQGDTLINLNDSVKFL